VLLSLVFFGIKSCVTNEGHVAMRLLKSDVKIGRITYICPIIVHLGFRHDVKDIKEDQSSASHGKL
jgi:hypothetical protein